MRSFLAARGIELPDGNPGDPVGAAQEDMGQSLASTRTNVVVHHQIVSRVCFTRRVVCNNP